MKIRQADDRASIRALLDYLNLCHDGVIRRMSFIKARMLDENGDLVSPLGDRAETARCEIDVELLLNSYIGALPRQVVLLSFKDVRAFRFSQGPSFDYADVYEIAFDPANDGTFEFSFCEAAQRTIFLTLNCSQVVCEEYAEPDVLL